jgi:hypothetical protein
MRDTRDAVWLAMMSSKVGDHAIHCMRQGFEGLAAFFAREAAHLALAAMEQGAWPS